jgi:hypothetical protein
MPRTWSYRKREIIINEVKPKGVPPAAMAYLFLSIAIISIVMGLTVYTVGHPLSEPVIVGIHSDSYQTVNPNAPAAAH